MGRKPRLEFKGAIYHVIKRGNNRDYIFQSRKDKECLLSFIEYAKEDGGFNLLGYVIMDNHYHLIIQTTNKPLQKIMQTINNRYSKDYNKRHNRSDHVFGGRYKGILVHDDKYLFSLLRYVHTNPVRAKICQNISQYKWSSDHYYRKNTNGLVSIDKILNMFSDDRKIALEEYVRFMDKNEPMISQNAYYEYEAVDVIGGLDGEDEPTLNMEYEDNSLDGILRRMVANEEDFHRIKAGSRQRYLREYKISYVKAAVEYGYTFKEIGNNIGVSGEAVNRIVQ
ncbi:MAG: transposase [Bacillota bacterium]|nr:transposase [Bacillota bacterium]